MAGDKPRGSIEPLSLFGRWRGVRASPPLLERGQSTRRGSAAAVSPSRGRAGVSGVRGRWRRHAIRGRPPLVAQARSSRRITPGASRTPRALNAESKLLRAPHTPGKPPRFRGRGANVAAADGFQRGLDFRMTPGAIRANRTRRGGRLPSPPKNTATEAACSPEGEDTRCRGVCVMRGGEAARQAAPPAESTDAEWAPAGRAPGVKGGTAALSARPQAEAPRRRTSRPGEGEGAEHLVAGSPRDLAAPLGRVPAVNVARREREERPQAQGKPEGQAALLGRRVCGAWQE